METCILPDRTSCQNQRAVIFYDAFKAKPKTSFGGGGGGGRGEVRRGRLGGQREGMKISVLRKAKLEKQTGISQLHLHSECSFSSIHLHFRNGEEENPLSFSCLVEDDNVAALCHSQWHLGRSHSCPSLLQEQLWGPKPNSAQPLQGRR